MRNTFFPFFFFISFLFFQSCSDSLQKSPNGTQPLSFSTDTLSFDTIISGEATGTYTFEIYNKNKQKVAINKIWLQSGKESPFHINVDGIKIKQEKKFQPIDIHGKDSLRVFVMANTNIIKNTFNPIEHKDYLFFQTSSGWQGKVLLRCISQNVEKLKGKVIRRDSILKGFVPYQIFDSLVISKGIKVKVYPGAKFLFHKNSKIIVRGTLEMNGELNKPIIMRGDRLGNIFSLQAYDRLPGQWNGVEFSKESYNNIWKYVYLRNAIDGMRIDSSNTEKTKLFLSNCKLYNCSQNILTCTHSQIKAINCQITNAGKNCISILGGNYLFVHCTIANFYVFQGGRGKALFFSNANKKIPYPIDSLKVYNSIITGYLGNEIEGNNINKAAINKFNYLFQNCLIATPAPQGEEKSKFINCYWDNNRNKVFGEKNFYPEFDLKRLTFSFQLSSESQAIGNADVSITKKYAPFDILNRNRMTNNAPDIGCYQHKPYKK